MAHISMNETHIYANNATYLDSHELSSIGHDTRREAEAEPNVAPPLASLRSVAAASSIVTSPPECATQVFACAWKGVGGGRGWESCKCAAKTHVGKRIVGEYIVHHLPFPRASPLWPGTGERTVNCHGTFCLSSRGCGGWKEVQGGRRCKRRRGLTPKPILGTLPYHFPTHTHTHTHTPAYTPTCICMDVEDCVRNQFTSSGHTSRSPGQSGARTQHTDTQTRAGRAALTDICLSSTVCLQPTSDCLTPRH